MKGHAALMGGAVFLLLLSTGCSVGRGEGEVRSEQLIASDCWDREYDMRPDFFAAVPYRSTLQIRVQRGSDLQEVSDGLAVLIEDVEAVRKNLHKKLPVSLPPGMVPPGSPTQPDGQATGSEEGEPRIHAALYLQRSCHNQNIVLYALSGTFEFNALFSGDPNEKDAVEKFTDATFDIMMGDPRQVVLDSNLPTEDPEKQPSRVTGFFRFYFERGQPGQPFP